MNSQKEKEQPNEQIIDFLNSIVQKSRMEKRMFPNFDWMQESQIILCMVKQSSDFSKKKITNPIKKYFKVSGTLRTIDFGNREFKK